MGAVSGGELVLKLGGLASESFGSPAARLFSVLFCGTVSLAGLFDWQATNVRVKAIVNRYLIGFMVFTRAVRPIIKTNLYVFP